MNRVRNVILLPLADTDLRRHLVYLDEKAGVETVLRFYDAALSSFDDLALMAGMGTLIENRIVGGLRHSRVKNFDDYLIILPFG